MLLALWGLGMLQQAIKQALKNVSTSNSKPIIMKSVAPLITIEKRIGNVLRSWVERVKTQQGQIRLNGMNRKGVIIIWVPF